MGALNPYQPPSAPLEGPNVDSTAGTCPKCGAREATKVAFTWWGGALGARLFHVVRCAQCRTKYNGKTGGSLTKSIIIYEAISITVTAGLLAAIWLWP
jgi:hypothetical protein